MERTNKTHMNDSAPNQGRYRPAEAVIADMREKCSNTCGPI